MGYMKSLRMIASYAELVDKPLNIDAKPKRHQKHPEQPVQKSIVSYLRLRKFLFTAPDAGVNVKSVATRSILKSMGRTAGIADLVVWIPGGTVCIECKKPKTVTWSDKSKRWIVAEEKGRQSKHQKEFEKAINNLPGHHYFVATSVDDVVDYFEKNNIKPN